MAVTAVASWAGLVAAAVPATVALGQQQQRGGKEGKRDCSPSDYSLLPSKSYTSLAQALRPPAPLKHPREAEAAFERVLGTIVVLL